jgi:hypothetical protein
MVRRVALAALLVAPVAAAQPPRPAADPEWTPVGISVVKPDPDPDERPLIARDPVGSTTLSVQLHLPGRFILGVDPAECVLDRFGDNRNTNLLAAPLVRPNASRVTPGHAQLSGKSVRMTFQGTGYPTAGATKLRLRGVVGVLVGRDEKTVERKDVSVRKAVDLGVGTLKALNVAGREAIGGVKYIGTRPIKTLLIIDRSGEAVEVPRNPYSTSGARTAVAWSKGESSMLYTWPRTAPDPCTVRATYFDRVELVQVPVELDAGLGL